MIPIPNHVRQRETLYDTPREQAVAVWEVEGNTVSVNKVGESLCYHVNGNANNVPSEALGLYGRDPIPPEPPANPSSDWPQKKIQERRNDIVKAKNKRLMQTMFMIDRFRSIIHKNLEDFFRSGTTRGTEGYLNFIPVLENQGYVERRGETEEVRYEPLENTRVALFGMLHPTEETMIFARWCVLNVMTHAMHYLPVQEGTSKVAFDFLKNLDIGEYEKTGRACKPILEMGDDGTITNIVLSCFSEADPNVPLTEQRGAVTVAVMRSSTIASIRGYPTAGHAAILLELWDPQQPRKISKLLHITDRTGDPAVSQTILERIAITRRAKPEVVPVLDKNKIEIMGPTWSIPDERIQRTVRSVREFARTTRYVQLNIFSDAFDATVASVARLYVNYTFIPSTYLGPTCSAASIYLMVGSMLRKRKTHSTSDIVSSSLLIGAVGAVAYAFFELQSRFGNLLCRKIERWQNRDKDEYSGNCMSWVRYQLTKMGIRITSLPMLNCTPRIMVNYLKSGKCTVLLDQ